MTLQVSPPFDASDCVCAPSLLWWYQTVYADQRIVDVGSTAGKKMRERLEEGFGFGVWKWAEEGNWTHMQKVKEAESSFCDQNIILDIKCKACKISEVTFYTTGWYPKF